MLCANSSKRMLLPLLGACLMLCPALFPAQDCQAVLLQKSQSADALGDSQQPDFKDNFFSNQNVAPAADNRLQEALQLANSGEYEKCVALTRQFLTSHPDSAPAYEILGATLAMMGNLDEGFAALKKSIQLDPKQSSAYTKLGDLHLAKQEPAAAKAAFQKAIASNSQDSRAHQRLGLLFEQEGDTAAAIRHFEAGLHNTPAHYVGIKVNLGRLYNTRKEFTKTIELLAGMIDSASKNATGHIVLGTAYFGAAMHDKAIKHFQDAALLDPENGLIPLGIAYRSQGQLAESLSTLTKAQDATKNSSTAFFQTGETLAKMKKIPEALIMYQKALDAGYERMPCLRAITQLRDEQQKSAKPVSP